MRLLANERRGDGPLLYERREDDFTSSPREDHYKSGLTLELGARKGKLLRHIPSVRLHPLRPSKVGLSYWMPGTLGVRGGPDRLLGM